MRRLGHRRTLAGASDLDAHYVAQAVAARPWPPSYEEDVWDTDARLEMAPSKLSLQACARKRGPSVTT